MASVTHGIRSSDTIGSVSAAKPATASSGLEENSMKDHSSVSNSGCAEQLRSAERELAAFIAAAMELYGPEQARLSAEDWIEGLEQMDGTLRGSAQDWRAVTIAASVRLAQRINMVAPSDEIAWRRSTADTKVLSIPSSNCLGPALVA